MMNSFIPKHELVLRSLKDISLQEEFYFKPIKPKLFDIKLITMNISAEISGIDSEYLLFRDLQDTALAALI